MLKWLQGERRAAGGEPLLTEDPLATIASRGHHSRRPQPVYSVKRVNPLYRDGPTPPADEPAAEINDAYSRPYSPTNNPPGSPEYARPVSCEGSAPGGDLDTERVSLTSAGPARRPPRTPPPPPAPPPAPPQAVQLRRGHGWAGLNVLKMDSEYVSGMSVNLARLRPKSGEERRMAVSRQRTAGKAALRRRPPARSMLVANSEFVKSVVVTTIAAQPKQCSKMMIKTNSEYVVLIGTRCRHAKSVAAESVVSNCPRIRIDMNAVFVKRISPNCRHIKDAPSHQDWIRTPSPPTFQIGAPSQAPSLLVCSPLHNLPALPTSTPPLDTAPDSIVTDSLLLLTSPDLSLSTAPHNRPFTPALPSSDQLTPDHVLARFSQVITNSRSVSMVRRAGSDARSSAGSSSAGSVTSRISRGSGRPDPALAAAPVAFVTSLWERTGLRTNGRRLLVNEEGDGEDPGSGRSSGGRTPSPPVPPRLPLSQSWLQRLTELPGLRPTPTVRAAEPLDPAALTAVVVEPAVAAAPSATSGPPNTSWGRHVKFAGPDVRLGPPQDARVSDQQRLWNTYYGSGYGALQPSPFHLQEKHVGLHDRKVSEFTLDARGASALRHRAEASRRSRRLWRAAVVVLVLSALVGSIMLISWYCTKGRHLFGAL